MELWTYSPEDVQVLVGGVYPVDGLAEGTFIEVTKDLMPYKTTRSADGQTGRSKVTNSTYTIKVTVMASSPANDVFTKWWLFDEATQMGKIPFLVKDSLGTGRFFSATTWIEDIPSLTYGTDSGTRTWGLRSNQGIFNVGGNAETTALQRISALALSGIPLIESVLDGVFNPDEL